MKNILDCLVIMPVGPQSKLEHARDTAASFLHYFRLSDTVLLILDDTRSGKLREAIDSNERIRIIDSQTLLTDYNKKRNTRGMLFLKQLLALQTLSEEFQWKCLLRLDDDALVIGPNPHLDAIRTFKAEPGVGMLGAYLRRGDGQDKRPALRKQRRRIIKRLISGDIFRNPSLFRTLAMLVFRAKRNGYKLGDMCTGGSLFLSGEACNSINRLYGRYLLNLRHCDLADDLLLALCVGAAGFKLKDFSDKDDIMAINWRGLPMPLEELVERRKKIVHPIKDPQNDLHETAVRTYFQDIRCSHVRLQDPR